MLLELSRSDMRKSRRRKAHIAFLSLAVFMLVFSSFTSYALDDATVVLADQPITMKGWFRTTPSITSNPYSDSFWSSSSRILTPSASYLWRNNAYFDFAPNETITARQEWLVGWQYSSTIDFDVNYVYGISFTFSIPSMDTLQSTPDLSKLYLCFPTNYGDSTGIMFQQHSMLKTYVNNSMLAIFAPSSYELNSSRAVVNYNIGIFPSTSFYGAYVDTDSDGNEYIPIPDIYLWSQQAFSYNPVTSTDGTYKRINVSFQPTTASSFTKYTSEQWLAHVQEQGYNDLSLKIDAATGVITQAIDNQTSTIVGSIEDATDNIINAGDPVDISPLEDAHEAEDHLINGLYSTSPFSMTAVNAFGTRFNDLNLLFDDAYEFCSGWLDYVFTNNLYVNAVVYMSLGCALIFTMMKAVF